MQIVKFSFPGIPPRLFGIVGIVALLNALVCADTGPTEPALSLGNTPGWRVSLDTRLDAREFKTDQGLESMDMKNFWATLTVDATPWLSLSAKGGAGKADRKVRDGEWGPLWGVAASAYVLERVMHASPVAGKTERIGLEINLDYTTRESNFSDADFSWTEVRVLPAVVYRKTKPHAREIGPRSPHEMQMRGGLLFLNSEGDFGDASIEGNRNFGVHLGAGWAQTGWTTRLYTNILGDKEYEWGLGATYTF